MKTLFFLISILISIFSYSQCGTGEQCINTGTGTIAYTFVKLSFTTANTTITNDPTPNNGLLQIAKAVNAGCVTTTAGITTNIDVELTVSMTNPASTETYAAGLSVWPNGRLLWNGSLNNSYTFNVNYFESGTNTPVNINTLQQIADIDGDADYNNDGIRDDLRPIVDNFVGNVVTDDYVWAGGYTYYNTNANTLIYTGTGSTAGATYFYSAGKDNPPPFSAITSITPKDSSQNFILAWQNKSATSFGYYAGGFGGLIINFTGINYAVSSCNIAISGTIFNDANGNTIQNAGEAGTNTGIPLYAYLVNSDGVVIATTTVNTNGSYTLPGSPNSSYTIKVSSIQYSSGAKTGSINTTPPAGWALTGENGTGAGGGDGSPDGMLVINTSTSDLTNQNFGIERLPTANPVNYTLSAQPVPNDILLLNGTVAPFLNGSDPEDQPTMGPLTGKIVQITSLPTNGQLLYMGNPVLFGEDGINPPSPANPFTINNLQSTDLSLKLTGTGYTTTSFNYSYVDAAGMPSPAVPYTLNWSIPLPVVLNTFTVTTTPDCNVKLQWETGLEESFKQFEVEVADGGTSFNHIATVLAKGNNSSYSYLYERIKGPKYFRLKLVDIDKTYKYSKVVTSNQSCTSQPVKVYPNNTQDIVVLEGLNSRDQVQVFNTTGVNIIKMRAKQNKETVSLASYASGTYIIVVTPSNGANLQSFKVIKK